MEVRITYKKEEIENLCLQDATSRFGTAPEGKEWSAVQSYSNVTVELIDSEAPTFEIVPPQPPTVDEL
jgi:hypothetical protein